MWCLSIYFRIICIPKTSFFFTWGHCVFRCIWRRFTLKADRVWFAHNTYYISLTKWHDIMRWITIQVLYLSCTARHYIGFILSKTHIFELYMIISTVIKHVLIVTKNVIISKIETISYNTTLNNISVSTWCAVTDQVVAKCIKFRRQFNRYQSPERNKGS